VRWAKVVDQTRCIGCHACTTACKSENEVPLSVTRTYVKYVDVGVYPQTRRAFQVTRCNQCADAPCATACPTSAMYTRADGIVDFDKTICIGCKACIAACPYDAIFINPDDHSAEKCNFCAHRIDMGLEPACVVVCPTEAILVGDLNDPGSKVAQIVNREPVAVRRPEKDTRPNLFYKGAHQATLDPLAAARPDGGLFMWSEQGGVPHQIPSGPAGPHNSSAAAILSYDVPHTAPWDWRVSAYTWTKGIAAGTYLLALYLVITGWIEPAHPIWTWIAPAVSGVFLTVTGALLVWDLGHPMRFYYIFTRPQWKSWLVRGAFILTGYALVLGVHVAAALAGEARALIALAAAGVPLAVMTAVYTAYLFAQAKARDLWQNPLLPPHFLVQAVIAGAAALMPIALWLQPEAAPALEQIVAVGVAAHLLMIAGESTVPHGTAHARQAAWQMTHGAYRSAYWTGVLLSALGMLALWWGPAGAAAAMAGLLAYEHAYVQAGQAVPLA
jgi:Fe-S-cluster-containing dehydrogenase component/formate-dependent nitrite reductase membrane component NrfD